MHTILVEGIIGISGRKAMLKIPAGWYRVLSGAVKPGDCFLPEDHFWQTGEVEWIELTEFPPAGQARPIGSAA
jgi:hypothetical protein